MTENGPAIAGILATETTLSPRLTLKAWTDAWLPRQAERVRPAAYTADLSAIRPWIVPSIGHRRLSDLTPADIRTVHAR